MPELDEFEKRVRKALIDKDLSVKDLSQKIGISQAYLYDIFKGARPGDKQKEKIVQVLELEQ